jgi:hypothetical protein
MFRSSLNRLLDWAEGALAPGEDDCEPDETRFEADEGRFDALPPTPHPHRRELRWERQRRPGSLPHPPAHCISPVAQRSGGWRARDGSAR